MIQAIWILSPYKPRVFYHVSKFEKFQDFFYSFYGSAPLIFYIKTVYICYFFNYLR